MSNEGFYFWAKEKAASLHSTIGSEFDLDRRHRRYGGTVASRCPQA